jgi:polyphenol oxidase
MGMFSTAARDPIFFSHHSNIDYLWHVWNRCAPSHTNPTNDSTWLDKAWTFWDVDFNTGSPVLRSIKVRDVLDVQNNLRYTYPASPACCTLPAPKARQELRIPIHRKAVRQSVRIPARLGNRIRAFKVTPGTAPTRAFVLVIHNLHVTPDRSLTVHVFADLPSRAADAVAQGPNHLGYFSLVLNSAQEGTHRHPHTIVLPVTNKIGRFLQGKSEVVVTLVPVDADDKPLDVQLTYRSISIREQ